MSSRQADIEPSLYAKIEAGEILPTQAEANRLVAVLGVKRYSSIPSASTGRSRWWRGMYEVSLDQVAFYRELRDPMRLLVSR